MRLQKYVETKRPPLKWYWRALRGMCFQLREVGWPRRSVARWLLSASAWRTIGYRARSMWLTYLQVMEALEGVQTNYRAILPPGYRLNFENLEPEAEELGDWFKRVHKFARGDMT